MNKYKCRICGESFNNLLVHLYKSDKKSLKKKYHNFNHPTIFLEENDVKKDHLEEFKKIKKSVRRRKKLIKEKCFCGGDLYFLSWKDKNGVFANNGFVEIICSECGFVWNEYFQE